MVNRGCTQRMPEGRLCAAPAIRGEQFCYVHEPGKADEVAEARRLGGLRRRRERTVSVAHGLNGVRTVDDLVRVVEIAILDTLGLENSPNRSRILLQGAATGARILEVGVLEKRIEALELAQARHLTDAEVRDL
jgi:hypothetical protein